MSDTEFAERRRAWRRDIQESVKLLVESDGTLRRQDAVLFDISVLGARVQGDVDLSPGQSIRLIAKVGVLHSVPSRVMWVIQAKTHEAGVAGLQFTEPAEFPLGWLSPLSDPTSW
jgi:PilZ domain